MRDLGHRQVPLDAVSAQFRNVCPGRSSLPQREPPPERLTTRVGNCGNCSTSRVIRSSEVGSIQWASFDESARAVTCLPPPGGFSRDQGGGVPFLQGAWFQIQRRVALPGRNRHSEASRRAFTAAHPVVFDLLQRESRVPPAPPATKSSRARSGRHGYNASLTWWRRALIVASPRDAAFRSLAHALPVRGTCRSGLLPTAARLAFARTAVAKRFDQLAISCSRTAEGRPRRPNVRPRTGSHFLLAGDQPGRDRRIEALTLRAKRLQLKVLPRQPARLFRNQDGAGSARDRSPRGEVLPYRRRRALPPSPSQQLADHEQGLSRCRSALVARNVRAASFLLLLSAIDQRYARAAAPPSYLMRAGIARIDRGRRRPTNLCAMAVKRANRFGDVP